MTASAAVRQLPRTLWCVGRARWLEVLLLQASPILGVAFGGGEPTLRGLATLFTGSLLVTAHVFVFNDWAGRHGDLNDPRRAPDAFVRHGIGSSAVAWLAVVLLALALVTLGAVGFRALVLGVAIASLGILYSGAGAPGKGVPVIASALHLLGGSLHFLLGYTATRPADARGLALATFFGLVFAAGHLNQEVRDHEADRRNGIRTSAVAFGPRRALLASLVLFSAAYAELAILALIDFVPRPVLWATCLLWPLHVLWSLQALRGQPATDRARWLQRRYRVLFALVGVAMVAALVAS